MLNKSDRKNLQDQQEKINFNRLCNSVLESNRDIKVSLEEFNINAIDRDRKIVNDQNDFIRNVADALKTLQMDIKCVFSRSNDQDALNKKTSKNLENLSSNIVSAREVSDKNKDCIDEIIFLVKSMSSEIKDHANGVNQSLESLSHQVKKDLSKFKDEILEIPSGIEEVKKDLENKINCHAIDVKGFLREINILKNEIFTLEKKFEYLFAELNKLENK